MNWTKATGSSALRRFTGLHTAHVTHHAKHNQVFAGSLESANSAILATRSLFKDFGRGKKSGFYDNN